MTTKVPKTNFIMFYYFTEIRLRFFYLFLSFVFTFLTTYYYSLEIFYIIVRPLLRFHTCFIFTELTEALYTTINSCFFTTLVCLWPFFLYQCWCFLIPSNYKKERKQLDSYIFFSFFLFVLAIWVLYFLVLPLIYQFLIYFEIKTNIVSLQLQAKIQPYVQLVWRFLIFLTLVFQTPVFCFYLFQLEVLTAKKLIENRFFMYLFCVILAAFVSPPDVMSQSVIIACLVCSFEFLVWLAFFYSEMLLKKQKKLCMF